MRLIRAFPEQAQRERRLADLARAANEHHFSFQGGSDRTFNVAGDLHKMDYSPFHS
jgi:hypothetical protein